MKPATVSTLDSSFAASMRRYLEDMTPAQVKQYRDLCQVTMNAIDAYMASAQGMHRDVVRHFSFERSRLQRHIQHLEPAATGSPAHQCPQCRSIEFTPQPNDALRCKGCRTLWHATDLTGERFEFLCGVVT